MDLKQKLAEIALDRMVAENQRLGLYDDGPAVKTYSGGKPNYCTEPEQEPVDKNGSPCPEFWDWLPKAYNFDGDGSFTKYNMEVAFLAGKQSIAQQPPIAFMGTDFEGNPTKFRLNHFSGSFPLYTAPPKREWVGLTEADIAKAMHGSVEGSNMLPYQFARAIEQALKDKNT